MALKRTLIKASVADAIFSGKEFYFKRTDLRARNLIMEDSIFGKKVCCVEVLFEGEWELIKISFRDFLRDNPELI